MFFYFVFATEVEPDLTDRMDGIIERFHTKVMPLSDAFLASNAYVLSEGRDKAEPARTRLAGLESGEQRPLAKLKEMDSRSEPGDLPSRIDRIIERLQYCIQAIEILGQAQIQVFQSHSDIETTAKETFRKAFTTSAEKYQREYAQYRERVRREEVLRASQDKFAGQLYKKRLMQEFQETPTLDLSEELRTTRRNFSEDAEIHKRKENILLQEALDELIQERFNQNAERILRSRGFWDERDYSRKPLYFVAFNDDLLTMQVLRREEKGTGGSNNCLLASIVGSPAGEGILAKVRSDKKYSADLNVGPDPEIPVSWAMGSSLDSVRMALFNTILASLDNRFRVREFSALSSARFEGEITVRTILSEIVFGANSPYETINSRFESYDRSEITATGAVLKIKTLTNVSAVAFLRHLLTPFPDSDSLKNLREQLDFDFSQLFALLFKCDNIFVLSPRDAGSRILQVRNHYFLPEKGIETLVYHSSPFNIGGGHFQALITVGEPVPVE